MSHLPVALTDSEPWRRLQSLAARGLFPHCIAISAPEQLHAPVARAVSEMVLCLNRTGGDDCMSCRAWSDGEHPDFIRGGEPGKAPSIDACREIIQAMAYRPVVSEKRCAVIFSADRMLPPAANSLLKLAEEPPAHGIIFFLVSEGSHLLPTLKSRAWNLSFQIREGEETQTPPSSPEEWSRWVEKNSGIEMDDFLVQFNPWIRYLVECGDHEGAGRTERLKMLLETRRISRNMALDLTVLALKEGIVFEHLFGDFW